MEHNCNDCGNVWYDDFCFGGCPYCGSENVEHIGTNREEE
jgi:predicted  nucleic acid-binding Zn-ribbon protein